MADAVPVDDLTPWTEDQVARAVAHALHPFLSHEFGTICDDQGIRDVAAECARIAIATINHCSATNIAKDAE